MKVVYSGFDLCSPGTSVSMTINGPAPTILAMFMNTAIDQQVEKFRADNKREPTDDEAAKIAAWVKQNVRGTVQADILKEDQGQNTCIFSTEFSLKVMGDIAEYFVHHQVRNFYSVSISGYHIAEAGANPISQLAFTLSNGLTFVEAYHARGMHINREWGLAKNENPNQGAFIIDELTELVEEAVLKEFEKIAERGGVLGAMETGYQRGQIQEESMHYEMLKHTGEYPIVGVNTFRNPHGDPVPEALELARSTDDEKQGQLTRLRDFHERHAAESGPMLKRLQQAVIANANVFEVLMQAVRTCSLGQITNALFEVGGQYRRSI